MMARHRLQTIWKLPLSRRTRDAFNLFSGCPYLHCPPSNRICGLPCLPFLMVNQGLEFFFDPPRGTERRL